MLASDNISLSIEKTNMSTSPPTVLGTIQITLLSTISQPPRVTLITNTFLVSYPITTSSAEVIVVSKGVPLSVLNRTYYGSSRGGVYLSTYDFGFYTDVYTEYLIYNAEGSNSQLTTYGQAASSNYLGVKYLYTNDQSQLFAFYTDKNYFMARTLNADPTIMSQSYQNPTNLSLPEIGYQCCCLSPNTTLLFVLLNSGTLKIFDTTTRTFTRTISVSIVGINDCYFDDT